MSERIAQIEQQAQAAIAAATTTGALEEVRVRYLGRKAELPNLLRGVAQLPPEQRAATGKAANQARQALDAAIDAKGAALAAGELDSRLKDDRIDVTLPADPAPEIGRLHLITRTWREIEDVFIGLGFNVAEGPEIETVYYNFDALQPRPTHPARLMTDTFYVEPTDDIFDPQARLLRVHTSPVQIRAISSSHHRSISSSRVACTGSTTTPRTRPSFTRSRAWRSMTTLRSPTSRARCSPSPERSSARSARSGYDRTSSRSPSRASRSTCPASTATRA